MKENVLDVLVYLFENFMYDEPEFHPDAEDLQASLVEAGFSQTEISKALHWLDELAKHRSVPSNAYGAPVAAPFRVLAPEEAERFELEAWSFLMYLENAGVLNPTMRELVMDRAMALDSEEVDLEDLKWIVLMVLFNHPGSEASYAWMENYLFEESAETVH